MSSTVEHILDESFKHINEPSEYPNDTHVTVTELPNFQSDVEEGQNTDQEGELNEEEINPPRADEGKDAWLFLAGCFIFEALIWGFPFAFGVFQSYYSTHAPFDRNPKGIAVVGTCATGISEWAICLCSLECFYTSLAELA
ncbi:hypothetical protein CJF30_00007370 [Rutstroemia sp. NJR-2017a BBW]|nr:hypothetical protein CJF30_00007370 [Rutstroemia sp. NJR-2017a BBW]